VAAAVTDDWPAVRDSAIALGSISEAARRHGVSIDAACQRAKRESWPVGRRPAKMLAQVREQVAQQVVQNGGVRNVRTTGEVILESLAESGKRSKLHLSRYVEKTSEHAAKVAENDPETALAQASDVASVAKTAALVHGWGDKALGGSSVVNIGQINLGGDCLDLSSDLQTVEGHEVIPESLPVEHVNLDEY